MTTPDLSVIIPTHNPRPDYLARVLEALQRQTVPAARWELIVVDSASNPPLAGSLRLDWHPHASLVREDTLGTARAIVAGFVHAKSPLFLTVADDNVLAPDYLEQNLRIAAEHPYLGSWSGQVELELENPESPPPPRMRHLLCERILREALWSNDRNHYAATPWGAGMCIRQPVATAYIEATKKNPRRLMLDQQGKALGYGGDTDIAYVGCSLGLGMGVFPQLRLLHLISASRANLDWLFRSTEAHAYSEAMHSWALTGNITAPRSDLRGRIGYWLRWALADRLDKQIMNRRRRGHWRAFQELPQLAKALPQAAQR